MNAAPAGAPKRLMRNYLLNPQFQLKYTGMIVLVAVVLMIVLGAVITRTANTAAAQAHTASRQARAAGDQAERAMRESQTSSRLMRMDQLMQHADNPDLVHTIERQLADDDQQATQNLQRVQAQRAVIDGQGAEIEHTRRFTLYTLFASGLALVFLLGLVGIVITHKVVGPVFKMKRLLRQVGTGRLNIQERLRKGDELEDLFETFLEMVDSLKASQERELERLDVAIRDVEASGTAPDALKKLRDLQAEMRLALGSPESFRPPKG